MNMKLDFETIDMLSKGMLNSAYGMCVTDIVRDVISYKTDWSTSSPILADELKKYNNSVVTKNNKLI